MDLIYFLIDFILHIDVHLAELVAEYGVWGLCHFVLNFVL
nr:DedA protein [uncultured bacterium]